MAEIKHTFQTGKMNKDLDERLVPQGEYRDALNIEIRTSDGSDIGAVQTLYGNKERLTYDPSQYPINPTINRLGLHSRFVGSIADEKTNKAYFFVAAPGPDQKEEDSHNYSWIESINSKKVYKDMILQYDNITKVIRPVVIDIIYIEFTSSDLSGVNGSSTVAYDHITVTMDVAKLIRPGMVVRCYNSNGNQILDTYGSSANHSAYYNHSKDGTSIIVRQVDGANIYFDRLAIGDLSSCHAWTFTAKQPVLGFTSIYGKGFFTNTSPNITGINIINNLLFWTDNFGEPKKINIDRCMASPDGSFDVHTKLMISDPNYLGSLVPLNTVDTTTSSYLKEEHITVIRRAPRTSPKLEMSTREDDTTDYSVSGIIDGDFLFVGNDGILYSAGDEFSATLDSLFNIDDFLILECSNVIGDPAAIRVKVINITAETLEHTFEIQSIDSSITSSHLDWEVRLEQKRPFFELKFGRFSYRYKYQDGEYSTFAPWSELAFLPSVFDFEPKKGYNLGMVNTVRSLRVTDFIVEDELRPDDVVEVDILYKDVISPNVYIVKSIKRGLNPEWNDYGLGGNRGVLNISSEMIHRTLHSSQALRAWDNVPRIARAQEVTGNRIVYGNYLQNFNITQPIVVIQSNVPKDHTGDLLPQKSIKSLRKYKLGVVFGDKYGRETPVIGTGGLLLDVNGNNVEYQDSIDIGKKESSRINKLKAGLYWGGEAPADWMEYYKYYIKETTNEYYNLVMDRWYDAEDGNIWLSFLSADRNKLDEDTYIILKNNHGSQEPVLEDARYKILAIENEAPDFIKTTNKILGAQALVPLSQGGSNDLDNIHNSMIASFNQTQWETTFKDVKFEGIGWARIRGIYSGQVRYSEWIKISRMNDVAFSISLIEPFGESADMAGLAGFNTNNDIAYELEVKDAVVENRPEFDGRFFVKVLRDGVLSKNVLLSTASGMQYNTAASYKFSQVDDVRIHPSSTSSTFRGDYSIYTDEELESIITNGTDSGNDLTESTWSTDHFDANTIEHFAEQVYYAETFSYWVHMWSDQVNSDSTGNAEDGNGSPDGAWFLDSTRVAKPDSFSYKGLYSGSGISNMSRMDFSIISNDSPDSSQASFMNHMTSYGTFFRFTSDPLGEIYQVVGSEIRGFTENWDKNGTTEGCEDSDGWSCHRYTFTTKFAKKDDITEGLDVSVWDPRSALRHDGIYDNGDGVSNIEILKAHFDLAEAEEAFGMNAVWETEPKEDVGLDIYYEATDAIPVRLKNENCESFIPALSTIKVSRANEFVFVGNDPKVESATRDIVEVKAWDTDETSENIHPWKIHTGDILKFTHANGMVTESEVIDHWHPITTYHNPTGGVATYKKSLEFTFDVVATNQTTVEGTVFTVTDSNTVTELIDGGILLDNPAPSPDDIWEVTSNSTTNLPPTFCTNIVQDGSNLVLTIKDYSNSTSSAETGQPFGSQYENHFPTSGTTYSITINQVTGYYRLDHRLWNYHTTLPWFNCYSFGNGLESDRIRDDFNAPQIDNGSKASSTLEDYGEERRSSGMIYSGIYNSTSGVNNLNEFNMAESITKDLNPSYGSLQALKTRDTNVVAFCEDKVFKILANKDALYNADGSINVTASNAVLGDAQGFVGDYGISLNPESLAVDGYRMYFTDKQRNKVLRLSQDGLTPISDVGMTSWFRDNLKGTAELIGTFDEIKGEYNISLKYPTELVLARTDSKVNKTVSFNERSKGWSSFKSFIPETGLSINDEYVTGRNAILWSHHDDSIDANKFYGKQYFSTIDVLFNDNPGSVKGFMSVNYEGTQAKVRAFTDIRDGEYYNLTSKTGWYIDRFSTDLQEGKIREFLEKEGKWFNHITGIRTTLSNLDTSEFSVQGIGNVKTVTAPVAPTPPEPEPVIKYTLNIYENND